MCKRNMVCAVVLATMSIWPAAAQFVNVRPVVHEVKGTGSLVDIPMAWNVKRDASRNIDIPMKAWQAGLEAMAASADADVPGEGSTKVFTLSLGLKGDKAVKKLSKEVPSVAEGYAIEVTSEGATIAGTDEKGLLYGVATLLASMEKGKLETGVVVRDWPDVPFRGTVEGFYGTPWSHEARLSQLKFYGKMKMNVYIYGPKDDPFHRDCWRLPYPDEEAERIQALNEAAREHGVSFCWAIHPGLDIKWTSADRDALVAKLERMYDLGIRSFAVFFDDIWGEGSRADKQAELLNYVDEQFIHTHADVAPLIMCPTEYNRAWADDEGGYLQTLGTAMHKDIHIMWTGNSVVHCIDKESMEWVNSRIGRKAYIWWNFPVSDYVRDHILLGPAYGNGSDIACDMSGFVSNPMEHAEASKIALFGIADYAWNMQAYDSAVDWELALHEVLPSATDALRTYALFSKDLGPNTHNFSREEGDEIKDLAEDALEGNDEARAALSRKCDELGVAADVLLANKENPALIKELKPWLLQAKNLADYGRAVCAMAELVSNRHEDGPGCRNEFLSTAANRSSEQATEFSPCGNFPTFTDLYLQARSIHEQMYELENSSVRHALQTGIKVGTGVLMPTLNSLFAQAVDSWNNRNGTALSNVAEFNPFTLSSDVEQLNLLPVSVRSNEVSVTSSNEVINWQAGGALLIEADREIAFESLTFSLGVEGAAEWFELELYTSEGWTPVSLVERGRANHPFVYAGEEINGLKATKFRLTNISGTEVKVYFRSFKFTKE